MTWKLKPTVLITATMTSTVRTARSWRAYASPRAPRATRSALGGTLGGEQIARRIASSAASTARNETALIAKHAPTPTAAMIAPAIAGPTTREALKRLALSATAFGSSSRPTIWNVSECRLGASRTSPTPPASARA